jgi:hypothetical protein
MAAKVRASCESQVVGIGGFAVGPPSEAVRCSRLA